MQSFKNSAARYMHLGLAFSKLKLYDSAQSYFTLFCSTFSTAIFPINISIVCALMVHCFESRNMQPSSIKGFVGGIQFHLRCVDPSTNSLLENSSIQHLLRRFQIEKPPGKVIHLPITIPIFQKLITDLRNRFLFWFTYGNCFPHCFFCFF